MEENQLEKFLEIVNLDEKRIEDEIKGFSLDDDTKKLAILEVRANAHSVRTYLGMLAKNNYPLNDDLTRDEEYYELELGTNRKNMYGQLTCRLIDHLHNFRNVPNFIKSGNFKPVYADKRALKYESFDF